MLTLSILLPLITSLALAVRSAWSETMARLIAMAGAGLSLLMLVIVWMGFDTGADAPPFQAVGELQWIPALGVAWRVGVDGMALAISLMSGLLFLCALAWPADYKGRARQYYAWFLFLQMSSPPPARRAL